MSKSTRIILTIFIVASSIPLLPINKVSADATTALVAHWKMDETSWNGTADEVVDSSGNELHGTAQNSMTTAEGRIRNGGDFDGSGDYIQVDDPGTDSVLDFDTGDEITITTWIKPDAVSSYHTILTKGRTTSTTQSNFTLRVDNGNVMFYFLNSAGTLLILNRTSGGEILQDSWNHVAVTYTFGTGSSIQIYVNGTAVSSSWTVGTGNEAPYITNEPLQFGKVNPTPTHYFNGIIDDTRIYRRTLSAADIQEVKEQAIDIDSELMGHWELDESSYSDTTGEVIDSSGNSRHGTPSGGMTTIGEGKVDRAADFDGSDDSITISTFDPPNNFSYGAWINPGTSWPGTARIIDKWNSTSPTRGWTLRTEATTNQVDCIVSNDGTNYATATGYIPLDQWSHAMCVREDNDIHIYINGEYIDSDSTSSAVVYNSSNDIALGSSNLAAQYIDSAIDDARIYEKALTPTEVEQIVALGSNLTEDLSGYWKMDESSWGASAGEVKDSSGNDNHCTKTGAPDTTTDGKFNNAGEFFGPDGTSSNQVSCPGTSITNGKFSIAFWMYAEEDDRGIITKGRSRSTAAWRDWDIFGNGSGDLYFVISNGSSYPLIISGTFPSLNEWHHVVAQWDGTTTANGGKIYVDGELLTQGTATATNMATSYGMRLGGLYSHLFDGKLDDVRLYSRILTPEEIKLLYSTNPTVLTSNKQLSDQLDRINEATDSGHLIQFVTEQGIAAGSTIDVNFPSSVFSFGGAYDYTDMTLSQGSSADCDTATFTDKTIAATASGTTWGATYASDTITFTSGTDVIPIDTCVQIDLDTNGGTHAITNPSVTGNTAYQIEVEASGDTHTGAIIIVEQGSDGDEIDINANINTTLSFDVDVSTLNCENSTETSSSANSIDFGTLDTVLYKSSDAAINFVCIDVASNAANGVDVFIQSSYAGTAGAMDSGSGQITSATADLNSIPGPGYGARVQSVGTPSEGTLTASSPFDSVTVGDVGLIPGTLSTPASIVSSTGPVATASASRIAIEVAVKADPSVGAGQYDDILTFTATASF